ncbi:MAG TPA: tripartite tricarboxylate transporter TctB family protein [Methylomirabilota bacterium]|nr:tripartite tricarboxylate transporter TctB family protein [Methylomirabilota bacterium]
MSARVGAALAVLAVAGTWAWLARGLPVLAPEGPGSAFVPLLLCGLLALLALALLIQSKPAGDDFAHAQSPGWAQAAGVLALLSLYVAALAHLGYFLATLPFVGITTWLCGARSPLFILGAAVGLTFGVWLVLTVLFAVPLPRSPWL